MTDLGTSTVPANWYADNSDPRLLRWWDGTQWTAHTTPLVVPQPTPTSHPVATTPFYRPDTRFVAASVNTMATLSLVISLTSLAGVIFAPLLVLALAGIAMGVVALVRMPRFAPPGRRRGQAVAGIIVGAVSLIATVLLTVAAVAVYQQVHRTGTQQDGGSSGGSTSGESSLYEKSYPGSSVPYTLPVIEQNLTADFQSHFGLTVSRIDCDSDATFGPGDFFECVVTSTDHSTARAQIAMSDGSDGGYDMLVIDPPAGGDGSAGAGG